MLLPVNIKSKSVIVTHGDCPDGAACTVFAKKLFPEIQVILGAHKIINEQILNSANAIETEGILFITDISCDQDVLVKVCEILNQKRAFLCIYEHHETRAWLQTFALPSGLKGEILFDNGRCGSRIMYESLSLQYPELKLYENFSRVINDRDLWINKEEKGVKLAKLHQIYGDDEFVARFLKNPKMIFSSKEISILAYVFYQEKKRIGSALQRMEIKTDAQGYIYGVVYETGDGSDLLNAAIEKYNLEYALMLDLNRGKGSIRGKGNMDCAQYAEKKGGGGHKRASGFPIQFEKPIF